MNGRDAMTIRKATTEDLQALLEIFAKARQFMQAQGNADQWGKSYPEQAILENDIALGRSYLCEENGEILATFVLAMGEDSTYSVIEGEWLNDRPYGTIHRVATSGTLRGMTDIIFSWAFDAVGNLRGDTHADNHLMQRAFERGGFEHCGTIWVKDGSARLAYQRER